MANTWVNYTEAALGWTTLETGLSVVLYGALLTRIPPRVVARIGEARSLVHGLDVLAAVFLCFALVGLAGPKASVAVWPGVCLMVVGMTWDSAARSHASKLLPDSEQGSLQGTLSALTLMCNVVAGVLSNAVFGFFISPRAPVRWPGANFVVAAALVAAGGAVARRATRERD